MEEMKYVKPFDAFEKEHPELGTGALEAARPVVEDAEFAMFSYIVGVLFI